MEISDVEENMNLIEARQKKGLSQVELDEQAGLTRGTTNDIERGKNKNPSWDIVRRIATVLERAPEEIFPAAEKTA